MATTARTPRTAPAIHDTPRGVRIDLTIYVYGDGHTNVLTGDKEMPLADGFQTIGYLAERVLRPAMQRARRNAKTTP